MKRLTVLILGLVLLATLVIATEISPGPYANSSSNSSSGNSTNSTQALCVTPICEGRIKLDEKDSNGCYMYSCPTTPVPVTCTAPVCDGRKDTGQKDSRGCTVYACPTTPGPRACAIPDCDGRQDSGQKDANGCAIYVCQTKKAEQVSEQITCVFKDSTKEQECYASSGSSSTVEANTQKITSCKGVENCQLKFSGEKGEKVTWKSSCGGYQYTTQDGIDEKVVFECGLQTTPGPGIEPGKLINNGYMGVYWQCYNGEEEKESEDKCMPFQYWSSKAKVSCQNKCSNIDNTGDKCGVNSFSVIGECYVEVEPIIVNSSSGSGGSSSGSSDKCSDYKEACDAGKESACKIWNEECRIDDKITICKDSCSLDNKCYPFGYRKTENYCSDSGAFTKQLSAGEKCDNNFECSTNLCVSQQCISQGLIDRIIEWFKNIFG